MLLLMSFIGNYDMVLDTYSLASRVLFSCGEEAFVEFFSYAEELVVTKPACSRQSALQRQ
jgi:hypothetical protein